MTEIINRVEKSPLVSLDLDEFISTGEKTIFDLKEGLFQGVMLREKDFREFIRNQDWERFRDKNVGVLCSVNSIIPSWAYMLVATKLAQVAHSVAFGDEDAVERTMIDQAIDQIMKKNLHDAKVVIKGCGEIKNRDYAYFQLARKLTPIVGSMMYGEPCSTVPVYKKKKV